MYVYLYLYIYIYIHIITHTHSLSNTLAFEFWGVLSSSFASWKQERFVKTWYVDATIFAKSFHSYLI